MENLVELSTILLLFLIVVAMYGFILSFAIFGTKSRIDKGNKLADETNELLAWMGKELVKQTELLQRIEMLAQMDEPLPPDLAKETPAER